MLGVIPYAGLSFFTYETLKSLHRGEERQLGQHLCGVHTPVCGWMGRWRWMGASGGRGRLEVQGLDQEKTEQISPLIPATWCDLVLTICLICSKLFFVKENSQGKAEIPGTQSPAPLPSPLPLY